MTKLTWSTVKVGNTEDIGRAANWAAACTGAEGSLTVHQSALAWKGGGHCGGCASEGDEDGLEMHDCCWCGVKRFEERFGVDVSLDCEEDGLR